MREAIIGISATMLGGVIGSVITVFTQYCMHKQKQSNLFRLAALDKRLEVHQQAYSLWHKLRSVVHKKEDKDEVVINCQDWWIKNNLYLTSEARKAFKNACMSVMIYDPKCPEMVENDWPVIEDAGEIIVKAVNLPSIGNLEKR